MKLKNVPPTPVPALPEWGGVGHAAWARQIKRAEELCRGAGTGRHFAGLVDEARHLLALGNVPDLERRLADRRFVRAVATAWAEDVDLAQRSLSTPLVDAIVRDDVSRLSTLLLARLFLDHLDRLDSWETGLQASLRELVRSSVSAQPTRPHVDVMESLRRQDHYLFTPDGPRRLADHLVEVGGDFDAWLRVSLLSAYSTTRFARVARDEFYMAQIRAADPESGDHAFLGVVTGEVLNRQRTETTDEDGRYFGHRILTALTDKETRRPSAPWLEAVLLIAGDPRSEQTQPWRTWWAKLPLENRTRAVRWMNGINLAAFLNGVEAYAKASGNQAMERMLERRKRLLNGLYEQDRIVDVRLMLGSSISSWIRRSASVDLRDAARLEGSGMDSTAVIYVDCGDFCLVEGSHNFSLHVYVGGPLERLESRKRTAYSGSYLREEVPGGHKAENGERSYLVESTRVVYDHPR
ncbi:EH signature domain-containing protein [Kineococcus sp. NPDC059986]|uniref:EH signature domain-containing protein n=1 Tax=Kineococcus sp. NPDC059986 TaxID=3155538 RepID=UPI00344B7410